MSFEFTEENKLIAKKEIAKYPLGKEKSASMALLTLAQKQNGGSLNKDAIAYVAKVLNIEVIKLMELSSSYSMYKNDEDIGKYHIQVCNNLVCFLKNSEKILEKVKKIAAENKNSTNEQKLFSIETVECLGACMNAPVVRINDLYFEDLTESKVQNILEDLKNNKVPLNPREIKKPLNRS